MIINMVSQDDLKQKISDTLGNYKPEVTRICLDLIGYLTSQPASKKLHLTYSLLKAQLKPSSDTELLLAIQYLSGDAVGVLEMKFEFADESGEFFPVDDVTVAEARNTNVFYHPLTGEPVPNFQSAILVYFTPGSALRELEA